MPEYARAAGRPASRGRIALFGGLLLLVLVPLFVSLGLWQWRKAEAKLGLQADLDARSSAPSVAMTGVPVDADAVQLRRVVVRGTFDATRQVLLDNRIYNEQAGYHVITPLVIAGSQTAVLVNRGWIPAGANHQQVPTVEVPREPVELAGVAVVPSQRFFTLAPQPTEGWAPVWQTLDLARFRSAVPYSLQPVVLQLDARAPAGFVRDWPRPDERADKHRSYALQWFGFAFASVAIWAFFLLRPTR